MAHRGLHGAGVLRVRGGTVGASWPVTAKPVVIKGPFRRRGGCAMKVAGLTRGDLHGCPRCLVRCLVRGVVREGGVWGVVSHRGEVSRGRSTGGVDDRREGPNAKPRCRTVGLLGREVKASKPLV